jgi:hypothetical protein
VLGVSAAVVFERPASSVKEKAVDLDHEVVRRPEEVHQLVVDDHVALRVGQAGVAYQFEEVPFQFGLGPGSLVVELGEGLPEGPEAVASAVALQAPLQPSRVQEPRALGGLEVGAQRLGTELFGEVEKGALD